jgi:hypothetical protein
MKTRIRTGRDRCGYTYKYHEFEFQDIIEEMLWKNRYGMFVFAVPTEEKYNLESLNEIGKKYFKIGQNFDKYIDFADKETIERIDYKKKTKFFENNLELTLFYLQEVFHINDTNFIRNNGRGILTSSYLFSPIYMSSKEYQKLKIKGFSLPGLEVVELRSSNMNDTKISADLVSDFYKKNGWNPFIFDGTLYDREKVAFFHESRFKDKRPYDKEMTPKNLTIYNPQELLYVANKNLQLDFKNKLI